MADDHERRPGTSHRKLEIRRLLLAYVSTCPTAMDTLYGIAKFWIPRQHIRAEIALLEEVLSELAAEGILEAIGTGDERRYRRGPKGLLEPPSGPAGGPQ